MVHNWETRHNLGWGKEFHPCNMVRATRRTQNVVWKQELFTHFEGALQLSKPPTIPIPLQLKV